MGSHPTVAGPLTGGSRGWPFGSPDLPVTERGYHEAEFVLEGEARALSPTRGHRTGA